MQLAEASNGALRDMPMSEVKILTRVPFDQWPESLRDKVLPYLDLTEDEDE
jgi:hypothetical protein